MWIDRRCKVGRLAGAAVLLATTVVLAAPDPASAASFTQAPTRLYMTPAGESLPGDIAEFVGVQQGQLVFDGSTDPISQQVRSIVVDTLTGAAGCDLSAPPYDIDDCSRVQLGPVNHGRLWMGAITTIDDGDGDPGTTGPADDVYLLPSGARIDATYSVAAGSYTLGVNGTPQQLNDALADLVYTPDAGYYYVGSFNPENLLITVIPGNSDDNLPEPTTDNDSADHTIEIRVLNVNEFPSITAPADKMAQAGVELLIPAVAPGLDPPYTGTEYAVSDPDNDEDVDGAEAEPPVAEDPLPDGEHAEMLLIGYLDCGVPTTDLVNGFHLRGGAFQVDSNSVRSIVRDFFDYTSLPAAGQAGVDTVLDAIDAIEPGLTTLPLASNDPTDFTSLFAGIGTMSVVQYALSQVTFLQPAPGDTCTLWTAVSDLGNNGLPLQYFGTPPTGLELPMIGLDIDSFDITTGDLDEIDISFDAEPLYVDEGAAPVEAAPVLHITPAIHPEFTIRWEVNPRVGDPDVAGVATANSDFTGTFNNTLTIPENATTVSAPPGTNVLPDSTDEGNETFTFDLVLDQTPPAGWMVTSTTPQRTVVILDDDDADAQVTSFGDAEVIEGDAGTSTMTFTIELDKPADGTEQVSVGIAPGGSATNPDDFGDPVPTTVSFSAGSMTATVDVPVVGDLLVEGDHSFELTLSGGVDVTIVDGTATGTIRDDDGVIGVSVDDVTVTEGDAGTTNATFTLTLDEAPVGTETIRVTTGDGSATVADGDYDAATQDVAFTGPGTTATFTVLVNGDTGVELDETFTVTLSMPVGLVIVDGEGIGTITNDDAPPPDPAVISVADAFVSEGGVANETTITMTNPGAFSCYVTLTSANGTATAPGDYAALALDLIIPANTDTLVVPLDIVDDDEAESAELFSLTVALAAGSDPRCEIGDGTATVYIAASDGGSNTPPFVTIDQAVGQPDPTSDSPILFTVEFTEAVTGFDAGDISFAGSTTDAVLTPTVTGGPQTYTVSVAAVGATVTGTVVASIPAGAASDGSAPSGESTSTDNSVLLVVDTEAPTVTVNQAVGQADPTAVSPILFTVVFSEPVTGFETGDVTLGGTAGATTAGVSGSGTTYQVAVSGMTQDGTVIATVGAGVAVDAAANANQASTSTDNTVQFDVDEGDVTAPTVTVNQAVGQADPTAVSPILFTVVFSEPVVGFETGDVTLGGTAAATTAVVSGSGTTYQVAVSGMTQDGTVIATVGAGVAVDAAANANQASTSTDNTVQFDVDEGDVTAPTVTVNQAVGQADPTAVSPILFTVVFSEPVVGFETGDVTLGGTADATTAVVSGSGATYQVAVSGMTQGGTVIASVGAGVAADAATNPSAASTSTDNTVTYEPDESAPLTIDPPDDITVPNDPGQAGAVVTYPPATSSGGVPPLTISCDRASGTFFPLGTTTVTCSATDSGSPDPAEATGSFTITVIDTEPPVIATPPNLARTATSSSGVVVAYAAPTATDNAGPPAVTCTPPTGGVFAVGVSTVTCTATDAAGNSASSSFTVTVTAPSSGGLPVTGSDTAATLVLAMLVIGVGLATRRVVHRTGTQTG